MYSKQYYENKYEGYHLKALKNRPYLREFFCILYPVKMLKVNVIFLLLEEGEIVKIWESETGSLHLSHFLSSCGRESVLNFM